MDIDATTRLEPLQDDISPPRLVLSLLGPPQVSVNGEVVLEEKHQKPLTLLAYLAVEAHRPHRRGALAALFWPDQPERQAMQNLRKTLSRLRRVINDRAAEPAHLLVNPQAIQFNSHSDAWLDVTAFTEGVTGVQEHHHRRLDACPICLLKLTQAAEYYRGSFLAGHHSVGSESLDEWLTIRREQLEQQACLAHHALAKSHLAQGKVELACRYARRLLRLDPWNEAGQRLLLQALTLTGGRNTALIHYEIFRRELADELGVVPEDETLALVDQIQTGAFPGERRRTPTIRHPTPATPFVGREAEREQITDYLAGYDQRLLTISGPGGSGKSRLALEIVNAQHPFWRDGVWLVSLADVPDPKGLARALASTLGYRPKGSLETAGLIEFLKPKETLLILDNYEHLAADTTLIQEILRWTPQVSMLITSRVRLGTDREWIIPLNGLDIPPNSPESLEEAQKFSAVTLFLQNARQAAPDFKLTDENLPDVLDICRQVQGLPLGIELASAWIRLFPPRKIADEIERSQDFLQKPGKKKPDRLHSLRASFNYSYKLLPETERSLFRQLSIFRGGFTSEACQAITGKEHHHLISLLDKSLLESSTNGRLGLHLTLREYALEQLEKKPRDLAETRMRHGTFYLAYLQDREKSLRAKDQKKPLDEINLEIANILAAWNWAVDGVKLSEIKTSAQGLTLFYTQTSQLREGEIALGTAADRLLSFNPEDVVTLRVAGQLRLKQASLLLHRRQIPQLQQAAQEAIELAQQAQEIVGEAFGTFYRGAALLLQGEFEAALTQLERARTLARKATDEGLPDEAPEASSVEGRCLNMMAGACWNLGRFDEAKIHLEAMLPIFTRPDDQISKAAALGNLGILAENQGKYAEAKARYEQALHIHQEVGNPEGQSVGYVNLGELYLSLGALEEAESHLEQALLIIRKLQSKQRETMVLSDLSQLAHYRGEDETAREYGQQAIQLAEEAGDRSRLGTAWMMLGYALLGMGRLGESAEAFQRSVDLLRELKQPNLMMESLAGLAQVALDQNDLAQALTITEDILEHLETGLLDGATDPFQVYLTCYNVLKANHDARASELLSSAHRQLQERATKIGDEGLQRSFLENVPSQRELMRLVQ